VTDLNNTTRQFPGERGRSNAAIRGNVDLVLSIYHDIAGRFLKQPTPMPIVILQPDATARKPHPPGDAAARPARRARRGRHAVAAGGDAGRTATEAAAELALMEAAARSQDEVVAQVVEILCGMFSSGQLPYQEVAPAGHAHGTVPAPRQPGSQPGREPGSEHGTAPDSTPAPARYERALAMVRQLARRDKWPTADGKFPRYAFPRSALLQAIEKAVEEIRQDGGDPSADAVLKRLGRGPWVAEPPGLKRQAGDSFQLALLSALLVAAGSTLISHLSVPWLAGMFAGTLAILAILALIRQNISPLSWLGPASRWFAATTYLVWADVPQRQRWQSPRRAWHARKSQVRLVVPLLAIARYGPSEHLPEYDRDRAWQFYLQLRVLALLEDLRASHRPWTLDLRRRKRTCPPVVILPGATWDNGGLYLLRAISDIRSRRSEQDPLLVIAGVPVTEDVERQAAYSGSARDGQRPLYEEWVRAIRVDQSPSRGSAWPWVLQPALVPDALAPGPQVQPVARAPGWARLWPYPALAAVLIASLGYGVAADRQDCGEGFGTAVYELTHLGRGARDLVRSAQSPGQCVGIDTTNSAVFEPAGSGLFLTGAGQQVAAAEIEQGIIAQNEIASGRPHITMVYAGAVTSSADGTGQAQAANTVGELAGVLAWQRHVNQTQSEYLEVDIANGGQDMDSQFLMARKIAAAAARDPGIVGVVGLGRDAKSSQGSIKTLASAGLAIVDTTNSDDYLTAGNYNYFKLSPTNAEEASALRSVIPPGHGRPAVIFERQSDRYSAQQQRAARRMLHAAGYAGPMTLPYQAVDDKPQFAATTAVCNARAGVIYLAGRSDDLPNLMTMISQHRGCFAATVTVLSGDDLTKYGLPGVTGFTVPGQVTIYFAAQTDVGLTGPSSSLLPDLRAAVPLPAATGYCNALFADGTIASGFDAAQALYGAAQAEAQAGDGWERSGVPTYLRQMPPITDGATGTIAPASPHHSIATFQLTTPGGSPTTTVTRYLQADGQSVRDRSCPTGHRASAGPAGG